MKDLFSLLYKRLRLLPLLVVVAGMAFVVRIGDAVIQTRDLTGAAFAQEKADEKKEEAATKEEPKKEEAAAETPEEKTDEAKAEEDKTEEAKTEGAPDKPAAPGEKPGKVDLPSTAAPAWTDASDGDIDYSTLRKELYEDLLQRRQQLDEKEKVLGQREALLEAGEKEITRKFNELTGLRNEIQELLKKQSNEEDARIASLVKIYEGMKPKDAARIFNTLDMDIMIDVVSKMSERKSAPIIASMEADRARALTTLLAEQKKLPELPDDGTATPAPGQ